MSRGSRSRLATALPGVIGFAATGAGTIAVLTWRFGSFPAPLTATLLAFTIFIAVADLLEVELARKGSFSLALAPALAFAMLRTCHEGVCTNPPRVGEVAAAFMIGSIVSQLLLAATGKRLRLEVVATRLLVVLGGALAYRALLPVIPDRYALGLSHLSGLGLAGMLATVMSLEVLLQSGLTLAEEDRPIGRLLLDQFRATGPLLLSSISVSALLALSYPSLRAWTLPLFLAPLAATQYSFKQVTTVRKSYLQTVGALAKVPEMAGYTQAGHSKRVADLSVGIAKELGIGDPELHEIEYAALLHDIGRISLPDPEESKSTSNLQLALVGATIIEETGHFPAVADMVRDQHEPYRRRGEETNRSLTMGSKIIKVASAFDDLTEPPGPGRTPREAVEQLYLGMAFDYDPNVIQALTRVLERSQVI